MTKDHKIKGIAGVYCFIHDKIEPLEKCCEIRARYSDDI